MTTQRKPAKNQSGQNNTGNNSFSKNHLLMLGIILILVGIIIAGLTYAPIIKLELSYQQSRNTSDTVAQPRDATFGIIIPKIQANASVVANVNPYDSRQYQQALTRGVAHAKGTSLPGQPGNIFLFSHSSVNFFDAMKYNSIFYLLNKLVPGDEITLYYELKPYAYTVTEKKFVKPTDVSYLSSTGNTETLTLMTCWPPGTDFQRLLIIATRIQ